MNNHLNELQETLVTLENAHRQLDEKIDELLTFPHVDQFMLQRLKREKLTLKERITRINSLLIPDLNA